MLYHRFVPRTLNDILTQLTAVHGRVLSALGVAEKEMSMRLAMRLPLVHRTGKPGATAAIEIFESEVLRAGGALTKCERDAGVARTLYFFLGSGAYPKGNHAFLIDPSVLHGASATATPFDSGACADTAGHLDRRDRPFASLDERCAHLDLHMLAGAEKNLASFASSYIPAHFDSSLEYITRGQQSHPDRDTHHLLTSPNGDRRAWTIEVQRHGDVPLSPDPAVLRRIVVEKRDLIMDLPRKYRSLAAVASPRTMFDAIADHCVNMVLT